MERYLISIEIAEIGSNITFLLHLLFIARFEPYNIRSQWSFMKLYHYLFFILQIIIINDIIIYKNIILNTF